MNRRTTLILVLLALSLLAGALSAPLAAASPQTLSLADGRQVAVAKMQNMQRKLQSEGANRSSVSGCWRERNAVGCLGMVAGRDSFLRWKCAVPMTIRTRTGATAARRITVKFTDPMCSF